MGTISAALHGISTPPLGGTCRVESAALFQTPFDLRHRTASVPRIQSSDSRAAACNNAPAGGWSSEATEPSWRICRSACEAAPRTSALPSARAKTCRNRIGSESSWRSRRGSAATVDAASPKQQSTTQRSFDGFTIQDGQRRAFLRCAPEKASCIRPWRPRPASGRLRPVTEWARPSSLERTSSLPTRRPDRRQTSTPSTIFFGRW